MNKYKLRIWRNRLIFVIVVAAAIGIYMLYHRSFTFYDFSHLTPNQNFGEPQAFAPLSGTEVPGMVQAAENQYLALYIDTHTTAIAVVDRRNGHVWHSSPPGAASDPIANPFERGTMMSNLGFRFYDETHTMRWRWTYHDSTRHEQAEIFSIPNGVRIVYTLGDADIGHQRLPQFIELERFNARVLEKISDEDDRTFVTRHWFESRSNEGFMELMGALREHNLNLQRMLCIFDEIEYTMEDLFYDSNASGVVLDIDLDFFELPMDIVLDGDTMVVNVPLSELEVSGFGLVDRLDLMKFFGAGGMEDEGFLFVPSGSGGIIEFNNGKHREAPFGSAVYGADLLMNHIWPAMEQPIRLPVIGIQNNGAAMLAHVESGAALATIRADVAGRLNSYNFAWFSFTLRSAELMEMVGVPGWDTMRSVIQSDPFEGDITVRYHFIAGDNPGIGEMAGVYRQHLIDNGTLTPLTGNQDRSFYLDIIGAVGLTSHFLGVPYTSAEIMTSIEDAGRIVGLLEDMGVGPIQMQLHGWFNRGMDHDVARNVRPIRGVANRNQLQEMEQRLTANGGGLFPAVNFHRVVSGSRGFNNNFEVALRPTGFIGITTNIQRDLLSTRAANNDSDIFYLLHPGVLPFHVDDFIPQFNRLGLHGLSLADMGDILTESMSRRGAIDREHSRLVAASQIERIGENVPNIMVQGGNDFALAAASHLVGVPTTADMFYIIDFEVPFFQMVVHGFIEFAGAPANTLEHPNLQRQLLNMLATGASPRYMLTASPTRTMRFSPHERFYTTYYAHWIAQAAEHYRIFNEVYSSLRTVPMVDFIILSNEARYLDGTRQVSVTIFENGTRIYVNNTRNPFDNGQVVIPAYDFVVVR